MLGRIERNRPILCRLLNPVLLIFIFAAVITPDGNPVTQVMVGGPMVVLYLLGIAAAWLFGKSKKSDPDE